MKFNVMRHKPAVTPVFRQIDFGSEDFSRECGIRDEVLRKPLGLSLSDEDLTSEISQLHFGLFVADDLIACVIASPISSTEAKVRQMAVSPPSQGRGYGRLILERLEAELATKGYTRFWLHARVVMLGFYEKLGYRRLGPEFVEVGIPHVKMEKCLTRC